MIRRDFIVVDEAHLAAAETLQKMCLFLDKEISTYIRILQQVTEDAAKEGYTEARYKEYASLISSLRGQLDRVGTVLNLTTTHFVNQIDHADSYLY